MTNNPESTLNHIPSTPAAESSERPKRRIPRPGKSDRSIRRKEALLLLKQGKLAEDPRIGETEAEDWAAKELERRQRRTPAFDKVYARIEPTSVSPERINVEDDTEVAAIRRLAWMAFLWRFLLGATRGAPAKRGLPLAIFVEMAFALRRPDILNTHKDLTAPDPRKAWAYDYPGGPELPAIYHSIHSILQRKPVEATIFVNLELIEQLRARTDEDGQPLHPNLGVYCAVDGTLVEADVEQRSVKDPERRNLVLGERLKLVESVVYTRKGVIEEFVAGWKLMLISDIATTLPLIWKLCPANCNESEEALELVRRLKELSPAFPIQYLVGDSAYDNGEELSKRLETEFGIHPVFKRNDKVDKNLPWAADEGTPRCAHGLMKFGDMSRKVWDSKARFDARIPAGERVSEQSDVGMRWKCAHGFNCRATTYMASNWRLYTFVPRTGDHGRVALREVLEVRRNSIESIFASLKNLGLGNRAQARACWAGDVEQEWLLSLGLLHLTARRLVHENGDYEKTLAEAASFNLLEQASWRNGCPGPDDLQLARHRRERQKQPVQRPRNWPSTWTLERCHADEEWLEAEDPTDDLAA